MIRARLPDSAAVERVKVLVVGDVMLDRYWHGGVDRVSPEAPVPVVRIERDDCRLGGAGNVALNARSLGADVTLLGLVGKDAAGEEISRLVTSNSIGNEIITDELSETIVKLRVIARRQQIVRVDFESLPSAPGLLSLAKQFSRLCTEHQIIVFSDYGKGTLTAVDHLINEGSKAGALTLVDPKGCDYSRYSGANVVTPNLHELSLVVGRWHDETDLERRAQSLRRSLNVQAILLTRSEQGMTLFSDRGRCDVAANARAVADVTGAGDTALATFAVMLGAGLEMHDAMEWSNRAAGLVVEKFGTSSITVQELTI